MEERTEVTRVRRPALFSHLPFHLGNLCSIRSMRGCTWIFCSDLIWSCSPKYLHGKPPLVPVKGDRTWSRSTFAQLIGCTELFCRLIWSPENMPKACRMIMSRTVLSQWLMQEAPLVSLLQKCFIEGLELCQLSQTFTAME